VQLTVRDGRSGRGSSDVEVHRTADPDDAVRRVDGLRVTGVERAVVDAWGSPGAPEACRRDILAVHAARSAMIRRTDVP
jgi:hypothetical protein